MSHRLVLALVVALGMAPAAVHAAAPSFPGIVTHTYTSTDGLTPIPDQASFVALLTVTDMPGVVVDVDVTLDIAHTQADQLDISLVGPNGTTVTLTTDNGAQNDDVFAPVTFDDQAAPDTAGDPAPSVRNATYTDLVSVGTVQPEEALGALVGGPANGPWALVIVDDGGGQSGSLRGWSITISTLAGFSPGATAAFAGGGGSIPGNDPDGRDSSVVVSGLGPRIQDVNVTVDIRHPQASDIDLTLTAPSGRRIALVTDVGGGNDDLWAGTTFDDQAGAPATDTELPESGIAFVRVAGEGALAAFLGEDPNGTWVLNVVDDASGNNGTLEGWTLGIQASTCGDGVTDPGEACDDGNATPGDGCDPGCVVTGTGGGGGGGGAEVCDNGADDDGDGFVDVADPDCPGDELFLEALSIGLPPKPAALKLAAWLPGPPDLLPVTLLVADGNGAVLCAALGTLQQGRRGSVVVSGGVANGTVTLKVDVNGHLLVRGRRLALSGLDDKNATVGLVVGPERYVTRASFRPRGRRNWVAP